MNMLIPLILLLLGTGAGIGAGVFLMPAPKEVPAAGAELDAEGNPCGDPAMAAPAVAEAPAAAEAPPLPPQSEREYAKMTNQFIVPVVTEGKVSAMVVLSISIEAIPGSQEAIFQHEPKLRDAFLQSLFNHANTGGFADNFTSSGNMTTLRNALRIAAQDVVGDRVTDVLIVDIVRQDT